MRAGSEDMNFNTIWDFQRSLRLSDLLLIFTSGHHVSPDHLPLYLRERNVSPEPSITFLCRQHISRSRCRFKKNKYFILSTPLTFDQPLLVGPLNHLKKEQNASLIRHQLHQLLNEDAVITPSNSVRHTSDMMVCSSADVQLCVISI